jgi:carboxypeptidase C (cathepsin A)
MNIIFLICLAYADTDKPWSLLGLSGYAGEVEVNRRTGSSLFYWQFNSVGSDISTDRRPLILWLQGGPGCSGQEGMLGERISPIFIDDNRVPHFNNMTWALNFHLLTVDFPYNTGFSYSNEQSDLQNSTVGAVGYLYNFLQILYSKYPIWFDREFYIFGESYGGHWVPGLAYKILIENSGSSLTGVFDIPLKGIGIGDGWFDANFQSSYYSTYSFNQGLANRQQQQNMANNEYSIQSSLIQGNYSAANDYWNNLQDQFSNYSNGASVYNTRIFGWQNFGDFPGWLNLQSTKDLLNVMNNQTWTGCSDDVYDAFTDDIFQGFISNMMPYVLSSIKVLIYNGQDDFIVNAIGVENFIANLQWNETVNFMRSRKAVWQVVGRVAGYVQSYSNLTFAVILNSGHFAPFDQPYATRDMVNRFILNQGWN